MAINEKQRQERQGYIGASDVPAILGEDPFKSAYDIWAEKTGKVQHKEKVNRAVHIGRYLEEAILKMSEEELGQLDTDPQRLEFAVPSLPILVAHPDAVTLNSGNPVEAKSTNITRHAPNSDDWGKEGTDEVPDRVILQCTVQCMALKKEVCHNPVIIGGRGFVMFNIGYDEGLADMILNEVQDFWEKNVQRDIPPDSMPSMDIARRIYRQDLAIKVDDTVVSYWRQAVELRKKVEERQEEYEKAIFAALGTAEAGECKDGMVTFYMQGRDSIDAERLRQDHPDIAAKYTKHTEYRVLRFKKGKAGKKKK